MSNRFKELALKAGLVYVMQPSNPNIDDDLKKFAELVVRECTSILSTIDKAQLTSGEYVDPSEIINQHFGLNK